MVSLVCPSAAVAPGLLFPAVPGALDAAPPARQPHCGSLSVPGAKSVGQEVPGRVSGWGRTWFGKEEPKLEVLHPAGWICGERTWGTQD